MEWVKLRFFQVIFIPLFAVPTITRGAVQSRYEDVQNFLREQVRRYPQNARMISIGLSDSGMAIEGLAIGNGSVKNLVVATHHGNEYGSTEVAKAVAASLAESPIDDQTVYVVPVLNVSGYNRLSRREAVGNITFDPNRDYPGPCGTEGPFRLKSTAALAKFVGGEGIVTSVTLHTYYPAIVYPWGIPSRDLATPYDSLFKSLVQIAASESHYQTGNATEVIYPAIGTYEDYAYWQYGIWSLLFELGYSHSPTGSDIAEMIRVNLPGLRRMLTQAPRQRAERHDFSGRCSTTLMRMDRHDE